MTTHKHTALEAAAKPSKCPFCGEFPKDFTISDDMGWNTYTIQHYCKKVGLINITNLISSKQHTIEKWNSRPYVATLRDLVELQHGALRHAMKWIGWMAVEPERHKKMQAAREGAQKALAKYDEVMK